MATSIAAAIATGIGMTATFCKPRLTISNTCLGPLPRGREKGIRKSTRSRLSSNFLDMAQGKNKGYLMVTCESTVSTVMHTSASLTINENASSDVPLDMEDTLNRIVPEGNHYRHLDEGYDDMPAHVKASMMGCSLVIPVRAGRFHLGIWQGIWLNEHRNYGGPRRICITLQGTRRADGRKYA
ncbi:uncharacterized protein LOC131074686 isoform X5 [Cryptomeria japonica]|uniref:uncharacterized protein LOC131074686 isoform X5 n=1 Tax=Cryptomeria japonica TaxID=3369 RepID=UPI0025ABF9DE|nr:uncharacterized protein LOC131074686 isoform X5 [Cryptomeria japonica]